MAEYLTISLNELRALLRKAFEGVYGHTRDWNALTDLVLWLEFYDLDGLEKVFSAQGRLGGSRPKMFYSAKGERKVDAGGSTLLELNDTVGDFLIADARVSGKAIIHIENVAQPDIIAACVARCSKAGFAATAWWPEAKGQACIAFQDVDEKAPNLFKIELPQNFAGYDFVTVVLASSIDDIKQAHPIWFSFLKDGQIPANEIALRYDEHLDRGFKISEADYKRLCKMADRVLVEASEASRQGAGE